MSTKNNTNLPVQIGDAKVIAKGLMHQIVQRKMRIGEKERIFERAERAPGTRLIIIKDRKILLTKEWRDEQQQWDFRLPGGKVFDTLEEFNSFSNSNGDWLEAATEAAKKESREEVGIEPTKMFLFKKSACGATIVWDLYYFVVEEFDFLSEGQSLEETENIEINWFGLNEAKELALNGKMNEERSVGILLQYLSQIRKINL